LSAWQVEFLEDEIKRGQYPETIALLDRKLTLDPQRPDYLYARAEAKRLHGQDKDVEQALADLAAATAMPNAPAQAHRSLGLMLRERKDAAGAAAAFTRYLETAPAAPDAGLIKTYLNEFQT
jgi:regulator of sirC expression with transglutaminase-like and TPR domain